MKKFLMIFLTVCMVVSCMIVPSMAVDYSNLAGWYTSDIYVTIYDSNISDLYGEGYETFCFIRDDKTANYALYASKNDDGSLTLTVTSDSKFVYWYCSDNEQYPNWGQLTCIAENLYSRSVTIPSDSVIVDSSEPVKSEDGVTFFPPPPLTPIQAVEELTMEQSMAVQNQTVGVMKILVPCGVGCLALLMALPTLRKGFLRFLH